MKTIEVGPHVVAWVGERLGRPMVQPCEGMGVAVDGVLIGGVVFNGYTGPNITVSVAGGAHAWTPAFFRRVAQYVWGELGCLRVTIITEQSEVVALAERMGAEIEGTMRHYFGRNRHGVLMGVLKDEWRLRHG